MIIYIISDGKKGHLSQTRGLAGALIEQAGKRAPGRNHACYEVDITGLSWFSKLFYKGKELPHPRPDLILCAGHGTHLAALSLARHLRCLCMVCMRPSLPSSMFDLCIMPRHDLPDGFTANGRIFPTVGAINAIKPAPGIDKTQTLILIGGPSKSYNWDAELVLNQLSSIARLTSTPIVLTTSRRTPADFVSDLSAACPNIRVVPVEETGPDWVPENLAKAKEVWVTQDSVSMVYEALSSGAPVGIIEMPAKEGPHKPDASRIARGLNMLIADGSVCRFTEWAKTNTIPQTGKTMDEAGRTATYILDNFPTLLP
ncbi:MAG: mitochondrial fission ELM1 family protein [Akkermansia sp.]|nr:mitochondrial fission ELM1 family protein [Akkermansia sp.]MBR2314713.1 mitochondrial fission ELM1 family protein [Akkermansia sp.]